MAKMHSHRLRYEKSGLAVYISHLDTMACFQRAFLRAGLEIWQTEGFNRHAYVSIALPLPVGFSSGCEVMEFDLQTELPLDEVPARLNAVLPEGIRVEACYPARDPFGLLRLLDWEIRLEYDNGVPDGVEAAFSGLLGRDSLVVQKKSKKARRGYTEVDLIPLVRSWSLTREGGEVLRLDCRLAAQNPGLNPQLLLEAFAAHAPALAPDFVRCRRVEAWREDGERFR